MTTFIMRGSYSAEAIRQISKARTAKAEKIVASCDGKIVSVYATMGCSDLLIIAEFPDVSQAMKASVAMNKAFGISFSTVPALPVEEFDRLFSK